VTGPPDHPPTGPPDGTPARPPDGTATGGSDATPTEPPDRTPARPPDGTPARPPDGIADVVIIGAGVVGTAIARELARYQLTVLLVDAGCDVGTGTTKANTAILHTGFDAEPGSLESRLLRRGSALLHEYAARAGIPVERTGALVIAWTPEQARALPLIEEKARRNGYTGARPVPSAGLYQREPHLGPGAVAGLEIPDESIVCPWTTPLAYATEAARAGVRLLLRTRVTGVLAAGQEHRLSTSRGVLRARWLVNAAGLEGDRVDAMLGGGGFTIRPRRGELIVFDKLARPLVSSILLPVPTARTKGVLVAPTVYGNVLLGPTAQDIEDRADTSTTAAGLAALLAAGRAIMPDLVTEEVTATYAGLRAATEHRDYQIEVDQHRRYACVAGIRSTGLSASLGIAEYVADRLAAAGLALKERGGTPPAPPALPYIGQAGRRPYQDADRIAADPAYGEIVCHCERVTSGEIRDALASAVPPADLDGVRRRTRAMNGRCQGFYCAAAVSSLTGGGRAGAGRG
jgi:glycerol-3-phosphate dehydrogenase